MKNTTFVSAGAGSGKTHRLTQDIARMISDGTCKAEEIILTTFTETAAKELREKVRSTLYSKGLYEAAMNIDNAAIGTIHSIGSLVGGRGFLIERVSPVAEHGLWAIEASVVVMPGLSCFPACGIFPGLELNPGLLPWQADSLPLSHHGSPPVGLKL